MFKLKLNPFYSPNDSGTIESGSLSISDVTDELGKEDELTLTVDDDDTETEEAGSEVEKIGKGKEKLETTSEEDKELEDIEKELEDRPENEDELIDTVPRKTVLAKYPNLFKEFPHLDRAVYREQKYSELLPTLKDAQLAVDKAAQLDELGEALAQGNTTEILRDIKENDIDTFHNVVDNYLENLKQVDTQAYFHVLGNVIRSAAIAMSKSSDDDDKIAAKLLHKFIFNTDTLSEPVRLGKAEVKDEKAEALAKKEKEFFEKQLNTHVNTVNTRIHNLVSSAIDKNIDPRGSMNDFTREVAVEKCTVELQKAIDADTRFKGLLDKLWKKAAESDFNQESLDRIRSAYWSKAKGLLPDIIRKTRNTALKGLGTKSPNERNNPLPVGRPSIGNRNNTERRTTGKTDKEKAREIPKGTKTADYLMRD